MSSRGGLQAIRPYRSDDQGALAALVADGLSELGFALDPVLDADLADPAAAYLAVWVVTDGEEVVGSVAMRDFGGDHEDEPGRIAELKRMFLRPAYRRLGLGRRLLAMALSWAREHGYDWARLDTGSSMYAAQRFYEANGFERCGARTEDGAGQSRCEVLYRCRLR